MKHLPTIFLTAIACVLFAVPAVSQASGPRYCESNGTCTTSGDISATPDEGNQPIDENASGNGQGAPTGGFGGSNYTAPPVVGVKSMPVRQPIAEEPREPTAMLVSVTPVEQPASPAPTVPAEPSVSNQTQTSLVANATASPTPPATVFASLLAALLVGIIAVERHAARSAR